MCRVHLNVPSECEFMILVPADPEWAAFSAKECLFDAHQFQVWYMIEHFHIIDMIKPEPIYRRRQKLPFHKMQTRL